MLQSKLQTNFAIVLWRTLLRVADRTRCLTRWHIQTASLHSNSQTEEIVIGLNESRAGYQDFEKIGCFDDVLVRFLRIAKRLVW